MTHPSDEYRRRRTMRATAAERHERLHARLGAVRLALFFAAAAIAFASFGFEVMSAAWLLVPAAAFAIVVYRHAAVGREHTREERAVEFYDQGLARLEDRWRGRGRSGERFADPHHVYAADLDLFGSGGLFELLSTARTRMGEETLAAWLLAPAQPEQVRERQACIAELRELIDLREDIALLGEDARVGVHPDALVRWAEAPNELTRSWIAPAAIGLPLALIAATALWNATGLASPFVLILLAEVAVLRVLRKELQAALAGAEQAFDSLRLLAELLARIEREPFRAPPLRRLAGRLVSHHMPASLTIRKLSTIVQVIESRRNPLVAVLNAPLLISLHGALSAERWRGEHGRIVRAWLEVAGDFEALLSLASYSYEHPEDPFPELVEGDAQFAGAALGHPLIPLAKCVRNDVTIEGAARVLLISGSNMSGKSTLLRAVGLNAVLAMAGAPVRAARLKLSPVQVGASIRINDSLHEGSSRFYAEITRLRSLFDLIERGFPLLFLLDELLQGTNSHDRRIGAQAVLRAFVERGAIGLITTHDLSLTEIGRDLGGRLRNMHFEDELRDGRMFFDYRLRDGVVTKSNGLALMRAIGLPVEQARGSRRARLNGSGFSDLGSRKERKDHQMSPRSDPGHERP